MSIDSLKGTEDLSKRPLILIRTDWNEHIGFGHLTRCIAFAEMVREKFDVEFVCISALTHQVEVLQKENWQYSLIENEDTFFEMLGPSDIALLDRYEFNQSYQEKVKRSGCMLVCIDDIGDREFVADLIINHTPCISRSLYSAPNQTYFALGPDYALLRPAFLEQARITPNMGSKNISSVMICFGGSDPSNLTLETLHTVLEFSQFNTIHVVTGSGYVFRDELMQLINSRKGIQHHEMVDQYTMLAIMQASDLVIVPSSVILFEALAVKSKIISGAYVENQKFVYQNFIASNAFFDAGDFRKPSLQRAIRQAFEQPTPKTITIDGNSGIRICTLVQNLYVARSLQLRRATKNDVDITATWAEDAVIRRFSFNDQVISKSEHYSWFQRKISDSNCIYLIAEIGRSTVGSIRFDVQNNEATISFLVDKAWHGKGLGRNLLWQGVEYIAKNTSIKRVVGFVMEKNLASLKAFRSLLFKEEAADKSIKFLFDL